jgi:hypothetical protein
MNLTAVKMFGVVAFPFLLREFKYFFKETSFKIILIQFLYLSLLGVYFGWISPWVDTTGIRSGKDLPHLRFIVHLGSIALELSAALYMAKCFSNNAQLIKTSLKFFVIASTTSSIAAIIENYLRFDFYSFFTGQPAVYITDRMKGFNYEPRGLSQSCAFSLIILFTFFRDLKKLSLISVPILLLGGYVYTYSTAGKITVILGITLAVILKIIHLFKKGKYKTAILITIPVLIIPILASTFVSKKEINSKTITFLKKSHLVKETGIINKLEVFDYASANFLDKNKQFLLQGVGPGLIYLPATDYLTPELRGIWKDGFNALPHMGSVLLLSNGGIINFSLWITLFILIFFTILKKNFYTPNNVFNIVFIIAILYLFQIRPIYLLGLAVGLSFTLRHKQKSIQ